MPQLRRFIQSLVLSTVVLLTACVTTTMRSIQREPELDTAKIHKVLVIFIGKNVGLRHRVEDEFVKQFKKYGVKAAASYVVLPPDIPLEKAKVAPFAQAQGFDSALVSRVLGTQNLDPNIRGEEFTADPSTGSAQNLSQYFDTTVASPQYTENYRMAAVICRVFDVATEKRLWEGVSQTLVAEDVTKLVSPYVKTILESLYKPPKKTPA